MLKNYLKIEPRKDKSHKKSHKSKRKRKLALLKAVTKNLKMRQNLSLMWTRRKNHLQAGNPHPMGLVGVKMRLVMAQMSGAGSGMGNKPKKTMNLSCLSKRAVSFKRRESMASSLALKRMMRMSTGSSPRTMESRLRLGPLGKARRCGRWTTRSKCLKPPQSTSF